MRNLDDRIEESLAKNGYSAVLGSSLFTRQSEDEIVLCLNYDGLYGINDVNRFLQASNPSHALSWGESIYKVNDPLLFSDSDRFRPVIFNNMKGTIVGIDRAPGRITFDLGSTAGSPAQRPPRRSGSRHCLLWEAGDGGPRRRCTAGSLS